MCGIVGYSGNFNPELLPRMSFKVAHRGPDDSGIWINNSEKIGLAHRRLSILDLSQQGHQPMQDVFGHCVIVFNGEIYNFKELKAELLSHGSVFKSHTDTEVILNLYLKEGPSCVSRLNGIFSFAIWDNKEKILFLARDGLGVKPLYYHAGSDGFLFSSELKGLLCYSKLDRSLDYVALAHYLTYLWCPSPRTPLHSVQKLEPGHALTVRNGKIENSWKFYELPYKSKPLFRTEIQAIHEVSAGLLRAVERQMVSDVPVGAFLSGGLDSSAVVAMAKKLNPDQSFECFTMDFKGKNTSAEGLVEDLPYAKNVAKHLNVKLNRVETGHDMISMLDQMIYHLDEPEADPAALNVLLISQLAQQHGIKVLLSGAGGDDLFTGYRRHFALQQERFWSWLPQATRRVLSQSSQALSGDSSWGRRISKAFRYAELNSRERLVTYFEWIHPSVVSDLFSPEVREQLQLQNAPNPLSNALLRIPEQVHPLNQMLFLEKKFFLADHNLNYTDKMSMAAGVEVRVPFLDPDLVSLACSLPISFKQKGREGKWILKKAMESFLPHEVIYRPKTGFGVPLRYWLKNELKPLVDDYLSEVSINRRGLFSYPAVKQFMDKDRSGKIDGAYTIFSILCLERWCSIFLDQ